MTAQFLDTKTAPRSRRRQRPPLRQQLQPEHQWIVWEIIFKLSLNTMLGLGALVTLLRLIPFQQLQQAKLQEIQLQVQETETRVQEQRQEFQRSFDPRQSRRIMQEVAPRLDPNQRQVFLTPPSP
ncbi:hypothetical protein [Synechocystis sp. LKSZ1]|uniref:slr1601 family putative cell division protein n=1 Tax=Synechocystis sp. LKSZ1 TaxID=3144951 RepID=UPI00336BAF47